MSKIITASVNVAVVQCSLGPKPAEKKVLDEVKARFEKRGIIFQDRPGLYPVPPYKLSSEKLVNGYKVITIKQEVEE